MIATQGLIHVESRVAMLRLLGAMPLPERSQTRFGGLQHLWATHQPVGKDRSEVFRRSSCGDLVAQIVARMRLAALPGIALDPVVEPELVQVAIEQRVDAPVRRLLPDESLHFGGEQGTFSFRQGLEPIAHRVDEELLAGREAHRQRVEERRAERIAPVPARRKRRSEVNQQASYHQLSHAGSRMLRFNTLVYGYCACLSSTRRQDRSKQATTALSGRLSDNGLLIRFPTISHSVKPVVQAYKGSA